MKNFISLFIIALLICNNGLLTILDAREPLLLTDGREASLWTFHTGEGYRTMIDKDTGQILEHGIRCDLDRDDPTCEEKVYSLDFTKDIHPLYSEKLKYLSALADGYRKGVLAYGTLTTTSAGVGIKTGAVSKGAALAGRPFVAIGSGVLCILSAVGTGVFGYMTYKEYKNHSEVNDKFIALSLLINKERKYVEKCGHPRANFISELQKHGIYLAFQDNSGAFVEAKYYLDAVEKENKLYENMWAKARRNGQTSQQAYNEYFKDSCDQVPMTMPVPMDKIFTKGWEDIPLVIQEQTIRTSSTINLDSKQVIEFTGFDENDMSKKSEQVSIRGFLGITSSLFHWIDVRGSSHQKRALEKFREDIYQITVRKTWQGNDSRPYFLRKVNGKKYLTLNARWMVVDGKWHWLVGVRANNTIANRRYKISIREFLKDHYDLKW